MKRSIALLLACLGVVGSAWLVHAVWGQTADSKEQTITITKSQFEKYVAAAVAAEREKAARVTDEQVLDPRNWHKAIFDKAVYVIYTGPGQPMFHHWVMPAPKSSGEATAPPKGP